MRHLDRSWTRPRPTAAQRRADLWLALVLAIVAVASVEVYRSASGASVGWRGVEAYLWFGLSGLVLAWRRSRPLSVLAVESVIFYAVGERLLELGVVFTIQMTLFAALYAAWAWSRRPRSLWVVSVLVLVGMFGWLLRVLMTTSAPPRPTGGLLDSETAVIVYSLAVNVVYFLGAIAWGQAAYLSAARRAQVEEQRDRERRIQDLERRAAVRAERVRIARDLHDVVAHHVSGIGVQAAGAGRVVATRPERAREALQHIEVSARQAVTQMHQLVGLLREEDETTDREPAPGLAGLDELAAGGDRPAVEVSVVGAVRPLPPAIDTALFRVVQEAVTNVRRHTHAAVARVTVRHLDDAERSVEVEIIDDGPGRSTEAGDGGGYGLDGIRERATALGGTADIGPRPDGGFRVRVRVPGLQGEQT